jgi:hypothetical protein
LEKEIVDSEPARLSVVALHWTETAALVGVMQLGPIIDIPFV